MRGPSGAGIGTSPRAIAPIGEISGAHSDGLCLPDERTTVFAGTTIATMVNNNTSGANVGIFRWLGFGL
jgi:hypothetical protein